MLDALIPSLLRGKELDLFSLGGAESLSITECASTTQVITFTRDV
jgi:hypothetical protein